MNDHVPTIVQPETTDDESSVTLPESDIAQKSGKRSRMTLLVYALLLIVVCLGIMPTSHALHDYRTRQYKEGCAGARDRSQWGRLNSISDKWIEWDTDSSDAYVFAAEAHFQMGRLQEAADSLSKVSDDYHGIIAALTFCGELLFGDLNEPYKAEAVWLRMLRIAPEETHAHQRLIYFYAMSLQRKKLVDQVRQCLKLSCEPPEAYPYLLLANSLSFTDGAVVIDKWRQNLPSDPTLEIAEAFYIGKNKKDTTAGVFEKSYLAPGDQSAIDASLEKYPTNIEVLAYHIERRIYYGDTPGVVELMQQAPPLAMEDARFWRYRGWLMQQTSDYQSAEQALNNSIELDRFDWRPRWELGTVLRLLERQEDAEQAGKLAMKGKQLEEKLYQTNGRALTWRIVEEMREYIRDVGDTGVLEALDLRIQRQGGTELTQDSSASLNASSRETPGK
jgi:tetratricopeptide (TPR) repeat protein